MKKLLLMTGLLSFTFSLLSQAQNWKTNGNTVFVGDYLGTDNNEPLIFKANGNEGLRIKPNGELRIKNFDDNLYTGLVYVNSNGILTKLNFSGNANEVLLGNGTFGNISLASGWSFAGGIASTTGKVVIGNISSTEKLNVDGNILANGSISGTSINVVDIVGAGKEIKIMNSLCLKGQDVNIPGSRNMICGMNGDLYVQSTTNNYNTLINYGNTGKVGIGVLPTEAFHVGVTAKFDAPIYTDKIYTNRITSEDSIIHIGDSSLLYNQNLNRISWSNMTPISNPGNPIPQIKGLAIGRGNGSLAIGNNSIALGSNVRVDGNNSLVIGSGFGPANQLLNSNDKSLMIGFDSNIPTFFVSRSNGLNTTGAVGIATTYIPSGFKFAVEGKIIAEEVDVRLRADWPDFVFDNNYSLMPILEVKDFYLTNGYLPGFPSANELQEKGSFSLGSITHLQQMKIEELTLYTVDQEEKITRLTNDFSELKKQNEILLNRLNQIETILNSSTEKK